jgi:hypothetical protein
MQPQSGIRTWQWVVTVIVIIVLIIIGVLVFGSKGSGTPATDDTSASSTDDTVATAQANRVTMNDQYPGNVVYISSVQLDQPGYIAIHADNNGQPGKVIGSAHFDKGLNAGGKITLTQPMVDGQTYYAMLHGDNGDGKFSETSDPALKDSKGDIIMHIFKASTAVGAGLKG